MDVEKRAEQIKALLALDTLSRSQVAELCKLTNVGGQLPQADGWDSAGEPYWRRSTITDWGQHQAMQVRSVGFRRATPVLTRAATMAPTTWTREQRGGDVVAASEAPTPMFDFSTGRPIMEILVVRGATYSEPVSVLRDHQQRDIGQIIGNARSIRVDGELLLATVTLSSKQIAEETLSDVLDGNLRAVSVGYQILAWEIIPPGQSATIGGRLFRNEFDLPLRVVTTWEMFELSFVLRGRRPERASAQRRPNNRRQHARNSFPKFAQPSAVGAGAGRRLRARLSRDQ